ncbi:MAG TPA: SIMPL domain-containing protein [Acidimicrobiales bacterium]
MDAEVVVRGEGFAQAMPDRAVVRAAIEGEGASRDDAYRKAAELAAAVDDAVARHATAIDKATTAALVVHPKTRWRKGENVRTGWRASRLTVLEVTGFEHLGELMAALASAGASIDGPAWQVDPDNAAHAEARRLAAQDARRRADDYVSALGLRLGAVAWAAEPGMRKQSAWPEPRMMAARKLSAGQPDEVIDVAPEEMTIVASVEVGFSFAPAD